MEYPGDRISVKIMSEGAPTRGSVILSLLVAILAVLLSAGTAVFSVIQSSNYVNHSNQQWCQVLGDLGSSPPATSPNPGAHPGLVYDEKLYKDFVSLKTGFGC
jgi:hypothetical protein